MFLSIIIKTVAFFQLIYFQWIRIIVVNQVVNKHPQGVNLGFFWTFYNILFIVLSLLIWNVITFIIIVTHRSFLIYIIDQIKVSTSRLIFFEKLNYFCKHLAHPFLIFFLLPYINLTFVINKYIILCDKLVVTFLFYMYSSLSSLLYFS